MISSLGLKSEFYKTFRYVKSTTDDNTRVYVPTGYDPINDEFLITIRTEGYVAPTGPNEDQGSLGQPVEDTGDDIFGGVDEAPEGCMYLEAVNADPFALVDDGSCFVFGCTDPISLNHVPPPAEGVEVIPCNEKGNTTVGGDGETYPNPYDCECRYFNPCIFDAFSLVPNGRVTFSDVNEFLELAGSSSFTVPDIPNEYFPNHDQQLFTTGVINNLGLDFMWAANLSAAQTPPSSLAPGGTGWSFSSDIFDNQAYHFAVAAYTEGPDMTGYNAGSPVWTGSIQETWDNSPDVNYDYATGTWTLATTGEPIWTAQWSQAPSGNTLENFNGAEDGCVYIGCSDSNALNYDPNALTCSPEATDETDFGVARFDDDGGGGPSVQSCNELGLFDCDNYISDCGCKNVSTGTQCYSACCSGATVTHRFGCLTNYNHPSYGRSNINPNTDPYGVLDYLQNATSLGPSIIIETTPTAGFPAPSLYCPDDPLEFYNQVVFTCQISLIRTHFQRVEI